MDDLTLLVAASCIALAILVYLMWRDAMRSEWGKISQSEKKRWREEEERRGRTAD